MTNNKSNSTALAKSQTSRAIAKTDDSKYFTKNNFSKANASKAQSLMNIMLGVITIMLATQITVPLKPVPITLQSAAIIFLGLSLPKRDAVLSVLMYISLGALGAPIFAGGAYGLAALTGPTAGYLAGFVACAYFIATASEKFGTDNLLLTITYTLIGNALIYVFGVPYLAFLIGLEKALNYGILPFIIPGIVKSLLLASSYSFYKNRVK